jgi:hypothetical protein
MTFDMPLLLCRQLPRVLGTLLLLAFGTAEAATPLDAGAACRNVQKAVAGQLGVPENGPPEAGWFCEFGESGNPALLVVALKASRPLPTGKLLGWYAVASASGTVYQWDVATKQALPLKATGSTVPGH